MASNTTSKDPGRRDGAPSTGPTYRAIRRRLEGLGASINREIRSYPAPIAGCDQQFNKLLEDRGRVARELRRLDNLFRTGTVRDADLQEIDTFIRSTARDADGGDHEPDRGAGRGPARNRARTPGSSTRDG